MVMQRIAASFLALLFGLTAYAQQAKPLAQLDDMQFRGAYYQIARLPDKREKSCVANSVEMVARGDKLNQLALVDSCKTKGSYADVRNIQAKRQNKNVADGRFKISILWPFTRKYWVLAVAPDNSWFLSGTPNHKSLWIYAKTPSLDDATLNGIKSLATSNGYNLAKLIAQPQDATAAQGTALTGQ
jgi:apolipoprotein D and lipocalin family protein